MMCALLVRQMLRGFGMHGASWHEQEQGPGLCLLKDLSMQLCQLRSPSTTVGMTAQADGLYLRGTPCMPRRHVPLHAGQDC